jgi:protocatechuate 3,4-dioxygenase beta subunit
LSVIRKTEIVRSLIESPGGLLVKRLLFGSLLFVFLLQLSFGAQQFPLGPPQAPQPPAAKGTISGTVVKATTGEPIARVQVSITPVRSAPNLTGGDPLAAGGTRGGNGGTAGAGGGGADITPAAAAQQLLVIPTAMTDEQGNFVVKDVPAGSYRVNAVRNGYSRQEFGQKTVGRPGTVLNVKAGQEVKDVAFRLTPAATIVGRVLDINGDPLPGVSVQAMRTTFDATGKRSLKAVGAAKTNDLGEYRLYWMDPGRYFVNANAAATGLEAIAAMSAQAQAASGQEPSTPEEAQLMAQSQSILGPGKNPNEAANTGFVASYYPNTPDPSRAVAIELQPGSEIRGIDFTLVKDQKVRIRGKITDAATGKPPQMAQVSLSPREGGGGLLDGLLGSIGGALQGNTYDPATGVFEAKDVASGSYYLQVMSQAQTQPNAGARGAEPTNAADPLAALSSMNTTKVSVDVLGADIDNLNIMVTPGITIPGRIRLEAGTVAAGGQTQNPFEGLSVSLQSSGGLDLLALLGGAGAKPAADGNFTLPKTAPGDYKVAVRGMTPNMYIKEARLEQRDILGGVTIGTNISGTLEITVSPNAGQLEGTITDSLAKPVTGTLVVLIPDKDRDRHELFKMTTTDQLGHFTMRGVVPGSYRLFSWEDIEAFSFFEADVLKEYEDKGKPVVIRESDKATLDMKIIPAAHS